MRRHFAILALACGLSATAVPGYGRIDIPTSDRRALSVAELASCSGIALPLDTVQLPLDADSYLATYQALAKRGLVDPSGEQLSLAAGGREPGRWQWETLLPQLELRTYYTDADGGRRQLYHSNGDTLYDGSNTFLTARGHATYSTWLGAAYELKLQRRPGDFLYRTNRLYAKATWGKWSFKLGRDAERLGVGYHGSLLLDDNAATMNLWRIRTEEPLFLPGDFSILGGFRFHLFNGYLSDENAAPPDRRYGNGVDPTSNPNLLGMRLSYHPTPWLDLGLNRTILYGGGGRESYDTPKDWWELFTARNENVDPGEDNRYDNDQFASLDAVLRLPILNGIGPLKGGKLYWEYAGTDIISKWQGEDTGGFAPFKFNQVGNLGGIYLTTAITDLRFEYAQTSGPWYSNNEYSQGYSYRGVPLGHHMGGDARNWFVELQRHFGPQWRASIAADYEERGRSLAQHEQRTEWLLGLEARQLDLWGYGFQLQSELLLANVQDPLDDAKRTSRNEYYLGVGIRSDW